MATRRFTVLAIAASASLCLPAAAALATTTSRAQAAGLQLLPTLSTPALSVSIPGVSLSTPSVGTSVPSLGVSLPQIELSLPSVSVPAPSLPSVNPPPVSETPVTTTPVTTTPVASTPPIAESPSAPSSPPSAGSVHESTGATGSTSSQATSPAAASAVSAIAAASHPSSLRTGAQPSSAGTPRHTTAALHRKHRTSPRSSITSVAGSSDTGTAASPGRSRTSSDAHPLPRAVRHTSENPLESLGRHIPLPIPVPDWSKPIIIALLLLAICLGVRSRLSAVRARRLEGQRSSLLQDVGAMQAALVPHVPSRLGGLAASVAYRPADGPAAGGDFYDLFVPEPGKVAIILGDVAGHGSHALNQAALTRYTLRAYLQAGLEPRAALALAGRVLAHPEAENYATVAVALYDERDGTLTYASAGHPAPLLHGAGAHDPLEICCSPPLGWDVPTGLRQSTVSLPVGAVVCFFSDGLIEARSGTELLGRERLDEMLAELGPRATAAQLLHSVTEATTSTPDDMAACVLIAETACAIDEHVEELEADARVLDGIEVRRFLKACGVPAREISSALGHARPIAAELGSAVLRVNLEDNPATITVTAPSFHEGQAAQLQHLTHGNRSLPPTLSTS